MVSVMIPTTIGGFNYMAALMPHLSLEPNIEIIVIDNKSRDGTLNYLSNYDCKVIVNTTNKGFAKAHNQAARIAEGDYLLLLNNDTRITPGFIAEMIKTFELDPKIGIVGCLIYLMDSPRRVQHAGVYFTEDFVPYELGIGIPGMIPPLPLSDDRLHTVREVPSVTAACMMVKKSVWFEVNGLNEQYINGWEDNDFVLRVREKGYKVWYTGKTSIKHQHFGSRSAGRFNFEAQNRALYDQIWVHTGRAKKVLEGINEGQ